MIGNIWSVRVWKYLELIMEKDTKILVSRKFRSDWKWPEHTASQAISALISSYQCIMFGGRAQHYLLSSSGSNTHVRTQPNWVRSVVGYPGRPRHRPWSITQLNMSAPSIMCTLSRTPNCWSASCNPCRCFHFALKGTACEVGNLVVTLGSTAASTFQRRPEGVPALLELTTWNETME